ncbi:protealysin inhibitor emfourin [Nocardioides sp. GXQ0305]|uniref:protealysin inhibitor emfourin n=1 Tax=Nocardioides sp. GXQ0305 TaxID=3423912 RepID=UPI003D7CDA42
MDTPGDTLSSCHFVPPYLMQELARTGTLAEGYVHECLRIDTQLRDRRRGGGVRATARDTTARWVVHTADHAEELPGEPVRSEGEPESGDAAVDEAASGITATLDLFRDVFARDSFDDAGARLLLTAHYGRDYANAFWDGGHLVFGDGDGTVFTRFTRAADVIAHEFGHAVTEHTAGLVYQNQSGALNESVSDVFAACLKQQLAGADAAAGSWLIGEEIFVPGINARGLRDMENPGTAYDDPALGRDPQPAHMDDFVETVDDNGGVHINSGIPNRAFVLAARAVGGTSAGGAGRIWYAALTSGELTTVSDFRAFAAATVAAAGEHEDAVREAWAQVGVTDGTAESPAPQAPPTTQPGVVSVRRSGGIVGQVVEGSVDPTADDDRARAVRELLDRVDLRSAAETGAPQPDRYVYEIGIGEGESYTVQEVALDADTRRLMELVLDEGS